MNHAVIAMVIAIVSETILGIAYLGYSAYLLSFKEIPYTICGIVLFGYVFTSIGSFSTTAGSVFDACVNKKDS